METEQFAQIEMCEIGSKLTMKTLKTSDVLVSLLLTLNIFQTMFQYSNCWLWLTGSPAGIYLLKVILSQSYTISEKLDFKSSIYLTKYAKLTNESIKKKRFQKNLVKSSSFDWGCTLKLKGCQVKLHWSLERALGIQARYKTPGDFPKKK